jgi:hypothetical protein
MREHIGLICVAALATAVAAGSAGDAVAFTAAAQAQTSAAVPTFDGTYSFVSATKLSETYVDGGGRVRQCPPTGCAGCRLPS